MCLLGKAAEGTFSPSNDVHPAGHFDSLLVDTSLADGIPLATVGQIGGASIQVSLLIKLIRIRSFGIRWGTTVDSQVFDGDRHSWSPPDKWQLGGVPVAPIGAPFFRKFTLAA